MTKENPLGSLELFAEVSPATLDALWKAGRVRALHKKHILIHAREHVGFVAVQLSGKSILYNLTHDGRRKIIFILGPGAILNERVLGKGESSLFCETQETSRIFVVHVGALLDLMEQDFALAKAVLMAQEKKIWRMAHQLKNTMGSIYLERKLAAKLWKLARDFGVAVPQGIEIDVNLPITLLADMLGAPRETTSRICGMFMDVGLITIHKKRITVTAPERMAHFYKTGDMSGDSSDRST